MTGKVSPQLLLILTLAPGPVGPLELLSTIQVSGTNHSQQKLHGNEQSAEASEITIRRVIRMLTAYAVPIRRAVRSWLALREQQQEAAALPGRGIAQVSDHAWATWMGA
jgi:hypothetical protein